MNMECSQIEANHIVLRDLVKFSISKYLMRDKIKQNSIFLNEYVLMNENKTQVINEYY